MPIEQTTRSDSALQVDDNPSAFPHQPMGSDGLPEVEAHYGMTLRDWLAGQALNGMGTWCPCRGDGYAPSGDDAIRRAKAEWAYAQADAMLSARRRSA